MFTIPLVALAGSVLFNLAVLLFSKDVASLKGKVSVGAYLKELNKVIVDGLGKEASFTLKALIVILAIAFLFANLVTAILSLVAVVLGAWATKKAYQFGPVNSALNKMATYINKMRG